MRGLSKRSHHIAVKSTTERYPSLTPSPVIPVRYPSTRILSFSSVIPAKAGIQSSSRRASDTLSPVFVILNFSLVLSSRTPIRDPINPLDSGS